MYFAASLTACTFSVNQPVPLKAPERLTLARLINYFLPAIKVPVV